MDYTTDNFSAGDCTIDALIVTSSRGVADMTKQILHVSIFESMFHPTITADFDVIDFSDYLSELRLLGDETVTLQFTVPTRGTASYKFALHRIEGVKSPSTRSKTYKLRCVSEEALHAKTNYVQKSYNTQISSMIKDVQNIFLKSGKAFLSEASAGLQKVIVPNLPPFKAIDFLRRRAVSLANKSSTFLFFENQAGFNFKTIEGMYAQGPVRTFTQTDAVGHDSTNLHYDNILAYTVPRVASSTERIKYGMKRRIMTFNFRTHKIEIKDVDTSDTSMKTGGTLSYNVGDFIQKFTSGVKNPPFSFIPVDNAQRPMTGIAEASADQMSYLSTLVQSSMTIKTYGDPVLKVGDVVQLAIPKKANLTYIDELDPLLSGNFLITRLHHEIGNPAEKPRYTNSIELIRGNQEPAE